MTALEVSWFGDRAVSVALADGNDRERVARTLQTQLPHLLVRRGIATVLVEAEEPDPDLRDAVVAAVGALDGQGPSASDAEDRIVAIEVHYDGPDLAAVARALDCSVGELISAHVAQRWRVAMMGFAPGFGYLLPEGHLALPWGAIERRASPRTRVDTGSVAVAAGMSAVYPQAMPGGWLLIGRTSAPLFDAEVPDHPAVLAPGDLVSFVVAGP